MRFPGAAYVDIDANGIAHVAPSGFPGDGLCRALRCSRSGQLLAGFDGNDNVYEWMQGAWQPRGQSFGGRAVIYVGEVLNVRREWPGVGYRYVETNGVIVTAEETYAHPFLPIWEYTELPNGWHVGQGGAGDHGADPLIIIPDDGRRRLVQSGTCRFVNAYLVGDRIDIAWQESTGCDARSLTLTEALALPVLDDATTPPDPQPVEGDMIKSFERPYWLAPFYSHSEKYGDTPDHVGNSILLLADNPGKMRQELARVAPLGFPMILGATDLREDELNTVFAWWETGGDLDELGAKVTHALTLVERPVVAYLDKGEADCWPVERPAWLTDRVWPSAQAYRNQGESITDFDARVTSTLQRLSGYDVMGITLTPAFYTRNGAVSVEDIADCMPLYERWMWDYNIVCVMPFADRRPTGMTEHPELREHCRAFQYAVPATRPNRFDYWKPAGQTPEQVLTNKLGQSRAAVVLEPYLRELILGLVNETEPEPEPEPGEPLPPGTYPPELEDQLALVTEIRNRLFPDKIGQPLNDGEKAALWAKHVAWELRQYGVGLATAKPGSGNHGGACPEAPNGITTDIVAISNGVHWDFQIDGHSGAAFPTWAVEDDANNYPPIADRWIPAFPP